MGVSIYYTAERAMPLTVKEQEHVTLIIDNYNASFEYTEDAESFQLYDYDESEAETILAGATKVPSSMDLEVLMYTIDHWLQCLTEIRLVLANADWHVHLDDCDAYWVEDKWQLEK